MVRLTASTSSEATVTTGIISKYSVFSHKSVFSKFFRFLAAIFALKIWESAVDDRVIVLTDNANSFNARLDSKLIFVHDS